MRKRPEKSPKKASRPIRRIPPTDPEARDEGPRLLPFDFDAEVSESVRYFADLADIALRPKKKS